MCFVYRSGLFGGYGRSRRIFLSLGGLGAIVRTRKNLSIVTRDSQTTSATSMVTMNQRVRRV